MIERTNGHYSKLATASHVPHTTDRGIRALCLAAGIMALCISGAFAQQKADAAAGAAMASISARYPAGSIKSVETADTALADVRQERSAIEARFAAEEQACHPKFFATSCVDEARERRHQALMQLRKVELEANEFKRRERTLARDKAVAERNAKEEAERLERVQAIPEKESKEEAPQEQANEVERDARNATVSDRAARHEARLKRQQEEDRANAKERAENVAKYEKKLQAALERQKKVAQRKAEKEAKRRAEQASQPGRQQ